MEDQIRERLQTAFDPEHLELVNESYMHNVPDGAESHFKAVIVSQQFEAMLKVKRHQAVYQCLQEEMRQIHALALHTLTPAEFGQKPADAFVSPKCLGGSKAEQ